MFQPRVQGVIDFLLPHAEENEALADWLASHRSRLQEAFDAVGSIYAEEAARILNRIRDAVNASDPDWAKGENLGQKAIRALRSTAGVSSVLVGMRRKAYVEDVLEELARPVAPADRLQSWHRLKQKLAEAL
jgi:aryl-alcohol dehydrogenase-like predicted oxidoreductase